MKPVTARDIELAKTPNGGYSRATLSSWGVSWPPEKGWKTRLLEKVMEDEIKIEVLSASQVKAFIPFTALPSYYAGKTVKIVLCGEQSTDEPTPDLFTALTC